MGYIILGLFAGLLAVIFLRALAFTPKSQPETDDAPVEFDKDRAISALAELVKCKTVSSHDPNQEDDREFSALIDKLPQLYPQVFETCAFEKLPDRALLLKWSGKTPGNPTVMMAHYDVVPVNEADWEKPPFSAIIENGVLWGRGTLDTKATFNGILSAADALIQTGFQPEHDIYFAFSGAEEVNGKGAANIVDWFQAKQITPSLVVDEGGAVVEDVFPGVKAPCGMIGIAEKGMMNVRYRCVSAGGHASAPLPKTPITSLARACRRVVEHPFPMKLTKPAAEMFDTLGRHSIFPLKLVFANLWLFKPVLNMLCKTIGGDMNALVRTTTAFTMMQGSNARNVIPPQAELISNIRLNPADTVASAKAYLEKVVADKDVKIEVLESFEPSRISQTGCDAWNKVAAAVVETWPGTIVTPYLMVQCSDSRYYGKISDKVYRFSAMDMTAEERRSIHGNNERIRLDAICRAVEFYIRLMKKC